MDEQDEVADEILRLAQSGDSSEFFGPIPEERIDEAERELGLPLTGSYRTFLRRFGAGHLLGYSFDGLPDTRNSDDEMPAFLNVADTTKMHWKGNAGNGMPRGLIYVTDDGGDYNFYLDTTKRDERGECPVVVHGPGAAGVLVARDFLDFLRKLANHDDLF